jgi:hypothetical protein
LQQAHAGGAAGPVPRSTIRDDSRRTPLVWWSSRGTWRTSTGPRRFRIEGKRRQVCRRAKNLLSTSPVQTREAGGELYSWPIRGLRREMPQSLSCTRPSMLAARLFVGPRLLAFGHGAITDGAQHQSAAALFAPGARSTQALLFKNAEWHGPCRWSEWPVRSVSIS